MQGIGQLLWKLREKEGIRQKQLCLGISSVSKYARIEADQQEIDFFLIDRIMGRLGKSVERLTYILPRDIYDIYELRQEIQQKICQKKWEEAKQCLLEYEKNKRAKEPLHQQFIEQEGNCTDNARSGNTEKDRDFKCRGIQTSAISMGSLFWYRS